ncbi:hypothetical protein FOZ63_014950, partial [Perkinsus olseni]
MPVISRTLVTIKGMAASDFKSTDTRPRRQRLFNSEISRMPPGGGRSHSTEALHKAHWGESGFSEAERCEIGFRLQRHASARWHRKLRVAGNAQEVYSEQLSDKALSECPSSTILQKSKTRPKLRQFDTRAVLQQEQCPKYRHGSLIQRFILGNSAKAALEQLPPPLPKAETYAVGKVYGGTLDSEHQVAAVLDEIYPANVTQEDDTLWRRVRESLMQERSSNTRERRRQALTRNGADAIEIFTEATRAEPSFAAAKPRGGEEGSSRERGRGQRQRVNSSVLLYKQMVLQAFRRRIIARFGTLTRAFSQIAAVGSERDMKIREFSNTLIKTKICTDLADARMIFDAIDINGDGGVSVHEFMETLDSAAEITTLEDFRKRLITRYGSLAAAFGHLSQIWPNSDEGLDEMQFVKIIAQCGVLNEEAERLFNKLDLDGSGTLEKEELFSAMTAVSPFLFLEDMQKVMKEKCDISQIHRIIPKVLGIRGGPEAWLDRKLTKADLHKLAAKFDILDDHADLVHDFLSDAIPAAIPLVPDGESDDGNESQREGDNAENFGNPRVRDSISANSQLEVSEPTSSASSTSVATEHLISGVRLATPDFNLSEFRKKIVNRCFAIMDSLYLMDVTGELKLSLEDYVHLLEPLQISRSETTQFFEKIRLCRRMDQIPIYEFMLGLIVFCPQILVMEIQSHLARRYRSVPDALDELQRQHHGREVKRWRRNKEAADHAKKLARMSILVGRARHRPGPPEQSSRLTAKLPPALPRILVKKPRRASDTLFTEPPDAETLTLTSFKRFIRTLVGLDRHQIRDQTLSCIFYLLDTRGGGSTTWGELGSALAALQPPAHKRMSTPARYACVARTVNECLGPARRQAIAARAYARLHHMASALGRRVERETHERATPPNATVRRGENFTEAVEEMHRQGEMLVAYGTDGHVSSIMRIRDGLGTSVHTQTLDKFFFDEVRALSLSSDVMTGPVVSRDLSC